MSILKQKSILKKPSSGGASKFIDLEDTPDTYEGQKNKLVTVNETEDALEFVDIIIDGNI